MNEIWVDSTQDGADLVGTSISSDMTDLIHHPLELTHANSAAQFDLDSPGASKTCPPTSEQPLIAIHDRDTQVSR
jgi:hypothetical protein